LDAKGGAELEAIGHVLVLEFVEVDIAVGPVTIGLAQGEDFGVQ
jgi:hypothetical protein